MNTITVGIAEGAISCRAEDELITYSLGSCLGIMVYDPVEGIGGLIHCMLPLSKTDREKAKVKPYMFVDTGVSLLLQELFNKGMKKKNAVIKVAGGAHVLDEKGMFRIGERNYTVLRKILWKNGLLIAAEDVGGEKTRTVKLKMSNGEFTMKCNGTWTEL